MAEVEKKRVTLHPLKEDGSIDTSINLYPKTFLDGIVNREGDEVEVALKEEIPTDVVSHEELSEYESKSNKVTSLSASSTDTQYPSAKAVVDYVENLKSITLEVSPGDSLLTRTHNLTLYLNNFTEKDIGKKIYLYRKSQSQSGVDSYRKYTHPHNYDYYGSIKPIKLGYGMIAGSKQTKAGRVSGNPHTYYRPGVPNWMPHNGYMQTEWTITAINIQDKFIHIPLSIELLSLLTLQEEPTTYRDEDITYPQFEDSFIKILGGIQRLKFGLIDEDNKLIYLSSQTVRIFINSKDLELNQVVNMESDNYYVKSIGVNISLE